VQAQTQLPAADRAADRLLSRQKLSVGAASRCGLAGERRARLSETMVAVVRNYGIPSMVVRGDHESPGCEEKHDAIASLQIK
jgi:hypothetical protein